MAQDVLNLNEESFGRIVDALSQLALALRDHYDNAVKSITALSSEWDDEDHKNLLEALKSIEAELSSIEDTNGQLINEAKRKLEMIQARRNIKM